MRYKDADKQAGITNAAIDLINEIGLSDVSMSKIAKKAGVSASTLYTYFENKNDMLKKLYLTVKDNMQHAVFSTLNSNMPVKQQYEQVLKNYLTYFLNAKAELLFYNQCVNSPLIQGLTQDESEVMVKPFLEIISKGQADGTFKNVDSGLIFVYTISPLIQIAKQYFDGQLTINDETINQIIEMEIDAVS